MKKKHGPKKQPSDSRALRRIGLWSAAAGVLAATAAIIIWMTSGPAPKPAAVEVAGLKTGTAEVRPGDWIIGGADAVVTLIEYSDFQCPACRSYFPAVKQLHREFGKRLRVVYRQYPLWQIHKNARIASRAAEAAGLQGKFWEMHDRLFERQSEWSGMENPADQFAVYARDLDLDTGRFRNDLGSRTVDDAIREDTESGARLHIRATPTFFLNGRFIENPRNYPAFREVILDELAAGS